MFRRLFFALTLLFASVVMMGFSSNEVSALELNHNSEIYKKIIRQNIKTCYLSEPLSDKVFPKDWPNDEFRSLFGDSLWVSMPTGYTTLKGDNYISCKGLIYGGKKDGGRNGEYAGILNIFGKNISDATGLEPKEELAVGLGYEKSPDGELDNPDAPIYYALKYTYMSLRKWRGCGFLWLGLCEETTGPHDAATYVTGTKINDDGTVSSSLEIFSSGNGIDIGEAGISFVENSSRSGGTLSVNCDDFKKSWGEILGEVLLGIASFSSVGGFNCVDGSLPISYNQTIWNDGNVDNGDGATETSIVGFLNKHLPINFYIEEEKCWDQACMNYRYEKRTFTYNGTISNDPDYIGRPDNITLPGQYNRMALWYDRAGNGMRYFTGGTNRYFTDAEIYILYAGYLTDYYKTDFQCGADKAEHYAGREGYVRASNLLYDGEMQDECYVEATQNADKKVNGVNDGGFEGPEWGAGKVFYGERTFEELLNQIANLSVDAESIAEANILSVGDPGELEEVEVNCINSGGSGSLGWVVCPIMEWMGNAAVEAYTDFVEPSLRIEPKLFNQEGDSGTKQGWSIFQGIANILFIIMFLVVIFSQLTGMGIDNYGIKKILPKLIVVAILVNLSYYICLICVDLSNILGSGLRAFFDSLPASVPADVTAAIGSTGTGMGLLSVGLLAAVAVGGAWMIWSNPAMLLSLLVGALGVLISILFLFVLLAGREAAVVVLTVISPLAFVCYALPNTKSLFDKWLKLGQGLLLVYPICGLMVGGGNYASRMLLAAGVANSGFVGALTAMLMGIVPIFFVPTVLKSSFAAMGSIGAKISGIGKSLGGSLQRGVRNSNRDKDLQTRGMERRTRIRAGYDKNGNKM